MSCMAGSDAGVVEQKWEPEGYGLPPVREGGEFGFFDLRWCSDDFANASNAPPNDKPAMSINATRDRDIETQNNTASCQALRRRAASVRLMMARGRGVRIFAEGVCVPFGQDFHHPAIKVVDRMVHDGFETAIVFSMSFFNVVFQSETEVFVLSAYAHLLRPEHLDILHRNFGDPICAAV